jgi:hypothetical protein
MHATALGSSKTHAVVVVCMVVTKALCLGGSSMLGSWVLCSAKIAACAYTTMDMYNVALHRAAMEESKLLVAHGII